MVKPTASCMLEDKDKIVLNEFIRDIKIKCPNAKCGREHELSLSKFQYEDLYSRVEKMVIAAYNINKGKK